MHPLKMNREQRMFLVNLNNRLSEIEQQIKKETLTIFAMMDKRIADNADWINGYDIRCTVAFYLNENDPAYSNDKDNILAEFAAGVGLADDEYQSLENNWNHLNIPDLDNPNQLERHSWFYHHLYHHTKISWKNILRIGDILVDIDLTLQHHLKLSGKEAI